MITSYAVSIASYFQVIDHIVLFVDLFVVSFVCLDYSSWAQRQLNSCAQSVGRRCWMEWRLEWQV